MRVKLLWFLSGKVADLDETDSLLSPNSTVWELKGLIQLSYGFPARDLLVLSKRLLENGERLRDVGIVDQAAADVTPLTVHVYREEGLEEAADLDAKEDNDTAIHEFSHDDMIMAMRMIGKDVPVTPERLTEVRADAPRERPKFLDRTPAHDSGSSVGSSIVRKVKECLTEHHYGSRSDGVDKQFAIVYPGAQEGPFEYWDTRLPEDPSLARHCQPNEVVLELFFFGSEHVDPTRFCTLVEQALRAAGVVAHTMGTVREAGCIYPLNAVAAVFPDADALRWCELVFEDFGVPLPAADSNADGHRHGSGAGKTSSKADAGCAQQ